MIECEWNTGRRYTDHGQRIKAWEGVGGIIFEDCDRRIDGFIPWLGLNAFDSMVELKEITMFCYDHGHYRHRTPEDELSTRRKDERY